MSAFRVLNQAPQYLLADGSVNAGGKLFFYETDLTTPKNTWAEEALTTLNSNPVVMDAAGRTLTDVWGDGEYGVVMTDADDVVIWTRNNVQAGGDPAQEIPALVADRFLFTDGADLIWAPVLQVPDPTDLANYYLASDGTGVPVWQQFPEPDPVPEPDIVVTTTSLTVGEGTGDKFAIQTGTGTIPASVSRSSNVAITFGVPFTKVLAVVPTASTVAVNTFGAGAVLTAAGFTVGSAASGATITANITDDGGSSGDEIANPVSFAWVAFGLVAA